MSSRCDLDEIRLRRGNWDVSELHIIEDVRIRLWLKEVAANEILYHEKLFVNQVNVMSINFFSCSFRHLNLSVLMACLEKVHENQPISRYNIV